MGFGSKLASKDFGVFGESSWLGQGKSGYGDGGDVMILVEGWFSNAPTDKYRGVVNWVWFERDVKVMPIFMVSPWVMVKLNFSVNDGYWDKVTSSCKGTLLKAVFGLLIGICETSDVSGLADIS